MTNGEKFKEVFQISQTDEGISYEFAWLSNHDMAQIPVEWWNAEYKEPTTKNNLGVDCISRTRAIERLKLNFPISHGADNSRDRHRYMQALADLQAIKELPPVTPQEPRKGHWISHKEHCEMNNLRPSGLGSYFWCSECDCGIDSKNFSRVNYNYCPNCGCKMV